MKTSSRWTCAAALIVVCICASPVAADWRHLGPLSAIEQAERRIDLRCGAATLRLEAVGASTLRVRLAPDGEFGRDFSWAVIDHTLRGSFKLVEEHDDRLVFSTGGLTVTVRRDPCRISVTDKNGNVLVADDAERGMSWWDAADESGGREVRVWQDYPDGTAINGLGEKAGTLGKGGQVWTMWNTDAYAYSANSDPLYISVPFFLGRRGGTAWGVFFDNAWRTSFDFGKLERGVMSFGAEGGELDYYIFTGPEASAVLRRYTQLTGRMELPPKWALGYHQCRYSYYPEARVREVATTFREKRIPCDVLWYDIDYMNGYRCFTWNPDYFPDPKALNDELHAMGFHTIAIIDPGIKREPGYATYDSGTKLGAWLTRPDGEPYVGRVWPGPVMFPDFTNPRVREWWAELFPPFLKACGLDGVWNDMNEPANFEGPHGTVPLDLIHDNEGQPVAHRAVHNVYGMQMARATKAGIQKADPNKRAFTLTRASFAGGQRYGAAWTGDNVSSWAHLQMSIPMALNMGLSGMPFVGPDIGGFVGGASPELFARWIQMGALFPFARTHTGAGNPDQEPWSFGPEVEQVAREALQRRYELMPYFYTLFEEAARTGLPVVRPMWMAGGNAPRRYADKVFMLGPDIFVAPVLEPGATKVFIRLPEGAWYDANTDQIHGGGRWHMFPVDLHTLPYFVRAGAIIPHQSPVQNTGEAPKEPLILDVWPRGKSAATLYEDDGESLAYRGGAYRRTRFTCQMDDAFLTFAMPAPAGTFKPRDRSPLLRIHGLPGGIAKVLCRASTDLDIDDGNLRSALRKELRQTQFDTSKSMNVKVTWLGKQREHDNDQTFCRVHAAPHPPTEAGGFYYDKATGVWLVRMAADTGAPQIVILQRTKTSDAAPQPVAITFDGVKQKLAAQRFVAKPVYKHASVVLTVRRPWGAWVALPRLAVNAGALPLIRITMSTEHTTKIGLRFASEEAPERLAGEGVSFDVTPDGAFHEYVVDLSKLAGPDWTGTIYEMRLYFLDGARAGETIRIGAIRFVPRKPG